MPINKPIQPIQQPSNSPFLYDVLVIGAGAAGLFFAGLAGQMGLQVLVIDHYHKVAEKIRISGGGRANFTNLDVTPHNFVGSNPHFCRSALAQFTPQDFLQWLSKHGVAYHEKHKGQLFCDHSAQDLIDALLIDCEKGNVTRWQPCIFEGISWTEVEVATNANANANANAKNYITQTNLGNVHSRNVVVATGGLSIPQIGASDLGHRIAKQFGIGVTDTVPALVPLIFDVKQWASHVELAGVALPVVLRATTLEESPIVAALGQTGPSNKWRKKSPSVAFAEDLLFTHKGLSGPGVLQISNYWHEKQALQVNFLPQFKDTEAVFVWLKALKKQSKKQIANELAVHLPTRLATLLLQDQPLLQSGFSDVPDKILQGLAHQLTQWHITPTGTEGYKKAEVTRGGVDTKDISSRTMESKQLGLYFIGEVLDVTGWLGGYNFQWAWSSAWVCAQALVEKKALTNL